MDPPGFVAETVDLVKAVEGIPFGCKDRNDQIFANVFLPGSSARPET